MLDYSFCFCSRSEFGGQASVIRYFFTSPSLSALHEYLSLLQGKYLAQGALSLQKIRGGGRWF